MKQFSCDKKLIHLVDFTSDCMAWRQNTHNLMCLRMDFQTADRRLNIVFISLFVTFVSPNGSQDNQ